MPSRLHEDLLRLFQNRPALAAELAREALHAPLPDYREARIDSVNLSDLRPTEYRADLVILLRQDRPVHGIVVEVQLARDDDKGYVWPAYVCNLRNRIRSLMAGVSTLRKRRESRSPPKRHCSGSTLSAPTSTVICSTKPFRRPPAGRYRP